jgi:phosphoribosylaminoimidazole-succinocarboxamide synthase
MFFSERCPPRGSASLLAWSLVTTRSGPARWPVLNASMAYREVTMIDVREVLRQCLAGVGKRRLAARAGEACGRAAAEGDSAFTDDVLNRSTDPRDDMRTPAGQHAAHGGGSFASTGNARG